MEKVINSLRVGYLDLYLLKYIEKKHEVGMTPFSALISQEVESSNQLRAGASLIHSRLKFLDEAGHIKSFSGLSPNPKAKRPVRLYSITGSGLKLISKLESEVQRIQEVLSRLPA